MEEPLKKANYGLLMASLKMDSSMDLRDKFTTGGEEGWEERKERKSHPTAQNHTTKEN